MAKASRALKVLPPGDVGTAALEYAIILPVLLTMLLGAMDAGRVMWLQVTLDRAVEAAARCASVNATICGSAAKTQAFAATQAFGTSINATAFTSTSATCGTKVTGTLPFSFTIPWPTTKKITLGATACYPVL